MRLKEKRRDYKIHFEDGNIIILYGIFSEIMNHIKIFYPDKINDIILIESLKNE